MTLTFVILVFREGIKPFPTYGRNDDQGLLFSGDLGCTDTPILPDPDQPDACDLLVLESTYGDRNHTGRKNRIEVLNKNVYWRTYS
ncbi:MAG: hypothetical protein PF482_07560 [Desulfobacteraceae bacterium]|nr:hypothetical protein [Desulfobacteraceae bacterium]